MHKGSLWSLRSVPQEPKYFVNEGNTGNKSNDLYRKK